MISLAPSRAKFASLLGGLQPVVSRGRTRAHTQWQAFRARPPVQQYAAAGGAAILLLALLAALLMQSPAAAPQALSVSLPENPHLVTLKTPPRPGSEPAAMPGLTAEEQAMVDAAAPPPEAVSEEGAAGAVKVPLVTQLRQWMRARPVLTPAPIPSLSVGTPDGLLPRIGNDGREAWRVYSRPAPPVPENVPKIGIVLVEMGLSERLTVPAIEQLPGQVSIAFDGYSPNLENYIRSARADGHEVLVNIPAEPANYPVDDPGPEALLTRLPADQNLARLRPFLAKSPGAIGVTMSAGARFAGDPASLSPLLQELQLRGLGWIDSNLPDATLQHPASITGTLAPTIGTASAVADVWVDDRLSTSGIAAALVQAVDIAKQGYALIVARPYPLTVTLLNDFIDSLPQQEVALVPVSALLRRGGVAAPAADSTQQPAKVVTPVPALKSTPRYTTYSTGQ